MRIEQVEADRRAVRGERGPHVEVGVPARLEEERRRAVGQIRQLVEQRELVLCVELGVCVRALVNQPQLREF